MTAQEIDTQEGLENSILAGGITRIDGTVDRQSGIRSRTARRWLNQLGYKWQNVQKGVFTDGHERPDVIEYRKTFLADMSALLPYLVEFQEDGSILEKQYPQDCAVNGPNRRPIIMITHDESIFSANDGRRSAWIQEGHSILRPKGKGKGIMVSDFLLPWSRLNLFSLSNERQLELTNSGIPAEAAVYFEYGSGNEGYWTGDHLLQQIVDKALPIAEILYPGYELLFMFDNATSHSVYAKDALRVGNMNKNQGGQQSFLRPGWYVTPNGEAKVQDMWISRDNSATGNPVQIQKGIQLVLEERGLWPQKGLKLECDKPKCHSCEEMIACTLCVRGRKCNSCKEEREPHSGNCSKQRICDACNRRKERCQCVQKQYCTRCKEKNTRKSCEECEKLPPKCTSYGMYLNSKTYFKITN